MKYQSLDARRLLAIGTFFLLLAVLSSTASAEVNGWRPVGTRDRQSSESEGDATKSTAKKADSEPRPINAAAAKSARPIKPRAPRSQVAKSTAKRPAPRTTPAVKSKTQTVRRPPRTSNVQRAVAQQPVSEKRPRANRTVAYYTRPYPNAPWRSRPTYTANRSAPYAPGRLAAAATSNAETILPGEIIETPGFVGGPEMTPDVWMDQDVYPGDCDSCGGGGCGDCGGCGTCDGPCGCCFQLYSSLFAGIQGFKGAPDLGRNGNFGFHEGFEVAGRAPCLPVSFQFGMRFTQNNFNGDQVTADYRDDGREQIFLTAGVFRRADACCPWQFGVVFDGLHDEYWADANLSQVRFEISRVGCFGHEVGALVSLATGEKTFDDLDFDIDVDDLDLDNLSIRPKDWYSVFVRRPTGNCGEWRFLAGVSGSGDALLGGDFSFPLNNCFALEGNAAYLLSKEDKLLGQREDTFAISLSAVWYPFRSTYEAMGSPLRPQLRVADNSVFFVERK